MDQRTRPVGAVYRKKSLSGGSNDISRKTMLLVMLWFSIGLLASTFVLVDLQLGDGVVAVAVVVVVIGAGVASLHSTGKFGARQRKLMSVWMRSFARNNFCFSFCEFCFVDVRRDVKPRVQGFKSLQLPFINIQVAQHWFKSCHGSFFLLLCHYLPHFPPTLRSKGVHPMTTLSTG